MYTGYSAKLQRRTSRECCDEAQDPGQGKSGAILGSCNNSLYHCSSSCCLLLDSYGLAVTLVDHPAWSWCYVCSGCAITLHFMLLINLFREYVIGKNLQQLITA